MTKSTQQLNPIGHSLEAYLRSRELVLGNTSRKRFVVDKRTHRPRYEGDGFVCLGQWDIYKRGVSR